jgi:endonuclease/exonuclease/phosphatase family metal-dependent hydrolase
VLARLDADVVVLLEVEHAALLERLVRGPLAGGGYTVWLEEGYDPRGIDTGVLSRVPVAGVASHLGDRAADGRPLFARALAEVHLRRGGRSVAVLGAHLASRLDPAAGPRRAAQARRVREVADELRAAEPGVLVAVVGDLNDTPDSPALEPLLGDGALVDLGAGFPAAQGFTWSGGGARERIDYALVPQDESPSVVGCEVVAGEDVDRASDHRPLLLDLWLGGRGR